MRKVNLNFMDRFMSLCYDYIFLGLSIALVIYIIEKIGIGSSVLKFFLIFFIMLVVYFIEFPVLTLKLNGTLGMYLNDLKLEVTSGKMTYGRVLFRELFFKQLFYATIIGIIAEIIFFILNKKTIHDFYLKTKVFKKIPDHKNDVKKMNILFKNK